MIPALKPGLVPTDYPAGSLERQGCQDILLNNKNTFTIYWDMYLLTLYGIDKEGNKVPWMEPSNRLLERLYIGKTN